MDSLMDFDIDYKSTLTDTQLYVVELEKKLKASESAKRKAESDAVIYKQRFEIMVGRYRKLKARYEELRNGTKPL